MGKPQISMKPFNFFILVSLLFILGGFIFLKDGLSQAQSQSDTAAEINFDLANYLNYSPSAQSDSQKRGQTLLFFAATAWCQSCSELEKEISSRASEIPKAVTILKVDYDNDTAMNKKYAVTSQHTLVWLDTNGIEVKRWLGGDFDTLLQEMRKS